MSEEQGASGQMPEKTYDLTLNENEREVVTLALQELLGTVDREEHLIGTIQALLARLKTL
jgi:hypothetical protein